MQVKSHQGNLVDAEDVEFETIEEHWNKYRCKDGTTIEIKIVTTRVFRTAEKDIVTGEPIYLVTSSNVMRVKGVKDAAIN